MGVTNDTLYQNGVTIYIGENLPIDRTNPFDPINDSETSNEEYRRLIYASIKNLYYQKLYFRITYRTIFSIIFIF
jgi:hypothetical protein